MSTAVELPGEAQAHAVAAAAPAGDRGATPRAGALTHLGGLFRRHRTRILGVYGLLTLENLLRLAQPIALGWAIDGLLNGSWFGLALLALQHFAALILVASRQAFDARVFSGVYADMVAGVVLEQRARQVPAGTVAARSAMSREFVDFFQVHLPTLFNAAWSLAGALLMLFWFDPLLVLFCLTLLAPVALLNRWYSRRTLFLSRRLHEEQEREVHVIERNQAPAVRRHYDNIKKWWVRLSDAESINTGVTELFVLGLIVAGLVHYCTGPAVTTGDIFAVFRYVMLFISALDALPALVEHVSRLRDVARRVSGKEEERESPTDGEDPSQGARPGGVRGTGSPAPSDCLPEVGPPGFEPGTKRL